MEERVSGTRKDLCDPNRIIPVPNKGQRSSAATISGTIDFDNTSYYQRQQQLFFIVVFFLVCSFFITALFVNLFCFFLWIEVSVDRSHYYCYIHDSNSSNNVTTSITVGSNG